MTQVQVKSSDVIKLILQFLKQNNLYDSFQTLQKQSKITLNTIDTLHFINTIMDNKWDMVLQILNTLMINQEHLFNLYELILDDLVEHDRYQAAEFVIKNVVRKNIKNINNYRQRIMRVEYIIENPHEKAIYKKSVTEHRKRDVIQQCLFDINQDVQPNRLLKLLTQSIKFQHKEGVISPNIKLNLFEGKQKIVSQQQETIIKSIEKVVRYPQDAKINSVALSSGQQYLALGGLDGLIQIYNTLDYTLHTGIKFQADNIFLTHDHPVTIMQFNNSDEMLVSVDSKGIINIWNLQNGKLLRKIEGEGRVSSICWGMDPSHVVVGYQDINLYGIRSKLILKQYSMSSNEFLNRVLVSENKIYGITNSGLVKIFNYSSQEQLISTNLRQAVLTIIPIYQSRGSRVLERIIVASAKRIYELNAGGEEQFRYEVENGQLIAGCCVGEFLYEFVRGDDKLIRLNVVSRSSHKNVYYSRIDNEIIFCLMQRNKNLMITYDDKDNLNFWRPSH